MNKVSKSLLLVIAAILLTGCAKDQSAADREQQKLQEARNNFDKQKDPPLNADTHFAAGQLAEAQGNAALAVQQYREALKLDAKHLPSLYRLGVLHAQLKEYDQAVSVWEKYVKATKGSASAYSNLAFAHELAGDAISAEEAYKKGIAKEPGNQACRVNYGLMLARINRTDEAMQQLGAVLSEAEVHYNIASVYEQLGRKDLARVEYKKSLELNPDLRDAQTRLAAIE